MSFSTRRTEVAAALTSALTAQAVVVHPFQPVPLRAGSGWLELIQADTEDTTFRDLRATYNVVISAGSDAQAAEKRLDDLTGVLVEACSDIGRGVVVRPDILNIGGSSIYCVVATLITEVEAG